MDNEARSGGVKGDMLEDIFRLQSAYEGDMYERRALPAATREEWMGKLTIAMMAELAELNEELNYRWWKNPKPVDEAAAKEELVDILHFFVSMCLRMGMTAEELHGIYVQKNRENVARQHGLSSKGGYEPNGQE